MYLFSLLAFALLFLLMVTGRRHGGAAGVAFAAPIISVAPLKFADAIRCRTNKCYLSKQKKLTTCVSGKNSNKQNKKDHSTFHPTYADDSK